MHNTLFDATSLVLTAIVGALAFRGLGPARSGKRMLFAIVSFVQLVIFIAHHSSATTIALTITVLVTIIFSWVPRLRGEEKGGTKIAN